jgi:ribonuclease HI
MRTVTIWTDGGCRKATDKGRLFHIGAGVVAECEGHRQEWAIPLGMGTNSQAELLAIYEGLGKLEEDRKNLSVTVVTDSKYCEGVLTNPKWTAKLNIPLITAIKARMAEFGRVNIRWVKGHAAEANNNRADYLANIGCGRIQA